MCLGYLSSRIGGLTTYQTYLVTPVLLTGLQTCHLNKSVKQSLMNFLSKVFIVNVITKAVTRFNYYRYMTVR